MWHRSDFNMMSRDALCGWVHHVYAQVSRSHQNQAFLVRVSPNPDNPLDRDVGSTSSPMVIVRSKRNNRRKEVGYPDHTEARPTAAFSGPAPTSTFSAPAAAAQPPSGVPSGSGAPGSSMQEALVSVLGWIDDVLRTVQGAKWTVDPQPDPTRPLFSMRNPNQEIDRILHTYKSEVMQNLHIILEKAEPLLDSDKPSSGGASVEISTVLAKTVPGAADFGYPAFDSSRRLVGFYRPFEGQLAFFAAGGEPSVPHSAASSALHQDLQQVGFCARFSP